MSDQPIMTGDVFDVTITKSLPFGVLVEYDGVAGLVRGTTGEPGDSLRVRVSEYDAAARRFAALPA